MSELVIDQQRSSVERKFYRYWILIGTFGWPVGWAAVTLYHVSAGIMAIVLGLLSQIFEPRKPVHPIDWFRLSLLGFYGGFEFSWYTGDYNPVDLTAIAVLGSLAIVVYQVLLVLIIAGPIWLLLSFASLICPAERAKWRGLLFPTSAKSIIAKWFLNTGILVVVVVLGGISGSLIHRLGAFFGWSITGPEFNLVLRFMLGLTYGTILSRVGPRLICLIDRKFHRPASLVRQVINNEEKK